MYCKNCGQKLAEDDKFCNACGQKTESGIDSIIGQPTDAKAAAEKSLFNFDQFGIDENSKFDFSTKSDEIAKPTPPTEDFNWNIHTFPGQEVTKTDDTEFNWTPTASTIDTPAQETTDSTFFSSPELNWNTTESSTTTPQQTTSFEDSPIKLEDELFGNLNTKTDNTRKQAEEIDKFFTFNKKNEEFQSLLDKEYEKIKTGNMLGDEMDKANVLSEERFAVRKPEDPMEDLFASSGVIKGYQPKEFSTNVLDKIDAVEAEKKVREDAAKLIEEERAKAEAARIAEEKALAEAEERLRLRTEEQARLQAEEQAKLQAEEQARLQAEEQARLQAEEQARLQAEERARLQAEEQAKLQAEEQARLQAEEQAKLQAEEQARLQAEEKPLDLFGQEQQIEKEAQEFNPMSQISDMSDDNVNLFGEDVADSNITVDDIKTDESSPAETIRAVDKAAILAGMASANKIVEMDRAAAAQEANEKEATSTVELPDFLGHPVLDDELTENDMDNDPLDELFTADELSDPSIGDLFKEDENGQADPSADLTEGQMAERLDKQAPILQGADDTMVSDTASAGVIDNTAKSNKKDSSEEKGGKGRVVLKVFLVILIILLAMEIAGVAIKIIAPTSGAAKFIDKQLNKVITLVTGESDKQYNVFAATEEIRTVAKEDKTEFIKSQANKNKDGKIESITYDAELKLDPNKKYKETELSLTQELSDIAWYKNAANKQVYYDEAIVGAIIAYNSQKVNMVNFNDSSVLNLMKEDTPLYKKVSKMGEKGSTMTFKSLKIGQIRQAGESFYLWVSEKTEDSNEGSSTTKKIYELQPIGRTMKVVGETKI